MFELTFVRILLITDGAVTLLVFIVGICGCCATGF
jgi:hypothetical protein